MEDQAAVEAPEEVQVVEGPFKDQAVEAVQPVQEGDGEDAIKVP